MAEQKNGGSKSRRTAGRSRGRSHGYVQRSPAVCIVVHDPSGKPMPDSDATEIVNSIHEIAFSKGYLINFTRT